MEEPFDFFQHPISQQVISLVPSSVAWENLVIPIDYADGMLIVAMALPDDHDTLEKLRFVLNCNIEPHRASITAIQSALRRYYPK